MIASRDGQLWVEFTELDPRQRRPKEQKTIALPLNLYLLAVSESPTMESLRAQVYKFAGEFACSEAAKKRKAQTAGN